jgi:hypothetical protein
VAVNAAGRWHKAVKLKLGSNDVDLSASKAGAEDVTQTLTVTRKRSARELAAFREAQRLKRERRLARERAAKAARIAAFKAATDTIPTSSWPRTLTVTQARESGTPGRSSRSRRTAAVASFCCRSPTKASTSGMTTSGSTTPAPSRAPRTT